MLPSQLKKRLATNPIPIVIAKNSNLKTIIRETLAAVFVIWAPLMILPAKVELSLPPFPLDAKERIKERRTIPMTSSKMAAETSAVPTGVSSFFSSFRVATVMETDVAERITP